MSGTEEYPGVMRSLYTGGNVDGDGAWGWSSSWLTWCASDRTGPHLNGAGNGGEYKKTLIEMVILPIVKCNLHVQDFMLQGDGCIVIQ